MKRLLKSGLIGCLALLLTAAIFGVSNEKKISDLKKDFEGVRTHLLEDRNEKAADDLEKGMKKMDEALAIARPRHRSLLDGSLRELRMTGRNLNGRFTVKRITPQLARALQNYTQALEGK